MRHFLLVLLVGLVIFHFIVPHPLGVPIFLVVSYLGILSYQYAQILTARWLLGGVCISRKDAAALLSLKFLELKWILGLDRLRHMRAKVGVVILSGVGSVMLLSFLFSLLSIGIIKFFPSLYPNLDQGPSYDPLSMILLALLAVWAFALLFSIGQCISASIGIFFNNDIPSILIAHWIYKYYLELDLYKLNDREVAKNRLMDIAASSSNGKISYVAGVLLHESNPTRAAKFYGQAFESPSFPDEVKWQAADGFITLALFTDSKPHLAKMDEYSQQLLAAKPQDLSVHGTRGSVLIELGRIEEGKRMLEGVLEKDENLNDRAISAAYLAYAAHLEQRPDDVEKYMSWALESDPVNPILKRFAFLLPPEKKA